MADRGPGVFSTEIWLMICNELSFISRRGLARLSYTCHALNRIANEVLYQTVILQRNISDRMHNSLFEFGVEIASNYTKILVVDVEVEYVDAVAHFLRRCKALQSFRWEVVDEPCHSIWPEGVPRPLTDALLEADPSVSLHAAISCHTEDASWEILDNIEASRLVHFDYHITTINLHWFDFAIMYAQGLLLVDAHRLEHLTLKICRAWKRPNSEGDEGVWRFSNDIGKLPAIRRLELTAYDWVGDEEGKEHFNSIWDFSNLQHLKLSNMTIASVLNSVPYSFFSKLISLEIADVPDERWSVTTDAWHNGKDETRFNRDIWQHLPSLQRLAVKSHRHKFMDKPSMRYIGPQLTALDLSAFQFNDRWQWYSEQDEATVEDVEELHRSCPNLQELSLYVRIHKDEGDFVRFSKILGKAQSLHSLHLHTNRPLGYSLPKYHTTTIPVAAVDHIFQTLSADKKGSSFRRISIEERYDREVDNPGAAPVGGRVYFCDGHRWGHTRIHPTAPEPIEEVWMGFHLGDVLNEDKLGEAPGYFFSFGLARRMDQEERIDLEVARSCSTCVSEIQR